MSDPFIVCTLSRSRTKWLSVLLTHGGSMCHCEVAIGMREVSDIARFFARPNTGTAETAVASGWELLRYHVPSIRTVVVRRPVEDAIASMAAAFNHAGVDFDAEMLRRFLGQSARALDRMALTRGVLAVDFADLDREDVCWAIFAHCLGRAMPREHWVTLKDRNIQINMASMLRYYNEHRAAIARFKRACVMEMRGLIRAGRISRFVSV